ncbi:uncharacterized protein At3g17950-like [Andrographis paniculata]|uniref:uncharacterized protein At3g17950-like n=1 Tax=Andrographis paniculata TaxID=175694 RepID=UPI0021E83E99|nr:uncharacterized protein At3g17950-like [Andrographis paniculata]XP_051131818.1 uncharacterized protein At3g17950-like [Andrographis paniculata]
MAQQDEGWPLGLNLRVGMERNHDLSGSISFNTLLTGSPVSSMDSSSDLDTESTGSFFHDKTITLGSLIGISTIFERSTRGRKSEAVSIHNKKINKTKTWFFSLCPRLRTDAAMPASTNDAAPSLGHFLEAERRAACRRGGSDHHTRYQASHSAYGPDDFTRVFDPNSLFIDGRIAPPQSNADTDRILIRDLQSHADADETPQSHSCLCGIFCH